MDDFWIELEVPGRNHTWVDRLRKKEGHEIGICQWLRDNLATDEIYYDVGTCFGFFPALITEIRPTVSIHAFEAGWQQFYFLERNAIHYQERNNWNILRNFVGEKTKGDVISLDDYADRTGKHPTIIQIDVDGAENEVLKGCLKIIKQRKTRFLIEIHPLALPQFQSSVEQVLSYFEDYRIDVLTNIRIGNVSWSNDLKMLEKDDNPYILASHGSNKQF